MDRSESDAPPLPYRPHSGLLTAARPDETSRVVLWNTMWDAPDSLAYVVVASFQEGDTEPSSLVYNGVFDSDAPAPEGEAASWATLNVPEHLLRDFDDGADPLAGASKLASLATGARTEPWVATSVRVANEAAQWTGFTWSDGRIAIDPTGQTAVFEAGHLRPEIILAPVNWSSLQTA